MRTPDRGSTTGDSPLDRPRAQRVGCPKGERSESIPPVHASAPEPVPDGGFALSGLRNSAFPTIKPAPFRRPDKRERHPAFLSLQIPAFPPSIPAVAHTLSEQSSRLKICLTASAQLPIVAPRCPPVWRVAIQCGEVSEWLKEHAWKVCIRQRIGGSNPPLTAII